MSATHGEVSVDGVIGAEQRDLKVILASGRRQINARRNAILLQRRCIAINTVPVQSELAYTTALQELSSEKKISLSSSKSSCVVSKQRNKQDTKNGPLQLEARINIVVRVKHAAAKEEARGAIARVRLDDEARAGGRAGKLAIHQRDLNVSLSAKILGSLRGQRVNKR